MKFNVAQRMLLTTVTALLGVGLMTLIGQVEMNRVFDAANFSNVNAVPSLVVLDNLRESFLTTQIELGRLLESNQAASSADLNARLTARRLQVRNNLSLYEKDGCLGVSCIADDDDRRLLDQERTLWQTLDREIDELVAQAQKSDHGQVTARASIDSFRRESTAFLDLVSRHIDLNVSIASRSAGEAAAIKLRALYLTLGIAAAMVLIISLIGWFAARTILRQLGAEPEAAAAIAARLAGGEVAFDLQARESYENSVLSQIRKIGTTLERLAKRAEAVGAGNLDDKVELASDRDRLGMALNRMIEALHLARTVELERAWLKDGLGLLSQTLSGDKHVEVLCDEALALVARYLKAGRGVLYLYSEASSTLDLVASFMYTERHSVGASVALGHGAIGQVARERKPIMLNVGHEDVAPIATGTTQTPPRFTYTFPLMRDQNLVGVLELSTLERFNQIQQEYLTAAVDLIASGLTVARGRAYIGRLLKEAEAAAEASRKQAESLQLANQQMEQQQQMLVQQSEELQQSNAQMEESQQQLQQQSEELQQSNAQMEEAQLQMQQQNRELEASRTLLDERAQELERASQYKSEFLANMSHELRTPLNAIILLSKMMGNDAEQRVQGEALKWAEVIHRSGEDLLRLINDVLDLSKVEAGRMELQLSHIFSRELCEEMEGLYEHLAREKGLYFKIVDQIQGSLVTDRDKLSQILRNLLSNAFKFCKEGGITFSLLRVQDTDFPYRLSVQDTGIGIADDNRAMIFEAFRQADGSTAREFGGTGLGLTISQRFAELMGGTIQVDSVQGEGSTFTLMLPLHSVETNALALHNSPASLPQPQRAAKPGSPAVAGFENEDDRENLKPGDVTILLIDDDVVIGRALLNLNRKLGYKTLLARTGAEGLAMCKRYRPRGILLDLGLPDMDGSRVLHEIKTDRELANLPVHIVSARDRSEALMQQGAIGHLRKPAGDSELMAAEVALLRQLGQQRGDAILLLGRGTLTVTELVRILEAQADRIDKADFADDLALVMGRRHYRLAVIDMGDGPASQAIEAARQLRQIDADLALIFFSSRVPDAEDDLNLRRLSDCVIIKAPQADQRLLENVERFLRQVPATEVADAPIATPQDADNLLKGREILVVDDDPRNLFVMTAALERHGARVRSAVNGRQALELLKQIQVHLVLMDIMMPEMDGYETIAEIRKSPELASLPIVVVSAKAAPAEREKARAAGADDYLAKPVDYDVLVATAGRWCRERNA